MSECKHQPACPCAAEVERLDRLRRSEADSADRAWSRAAELEAELARLRASAPAPVEARPPPEKGVRCDRCNGVGYPRQVEACMKCDGKGYVRARCEGFEHPDERAYTVGDAIGLKRQSAPMESAPPPERRWYAEDGAVLDLDPEEVIRRRKLAARVLAAAREVDLWQPKLIAPGGLNPPGYCPPLERLRSALRVLDGPPVESAPGAALQTFYAGPDTPEIRDLFAAAERLLRSAEESAPGAATTKCACGYRSVLTATGVRYEDTSEAICKHTAKACQWFHPAAHPFAVRPAHPCGCGHGHLRGSDGEDGGCSECDCTSWRAPASPPAEPPATCQEPIVKRTYHNAFGMHQDKGLCGLPMPCPTHQAEPPAPAAEPGTCPHHKMKWIEGTACPRCGGRRFWHSGMGETTTDEHQKCIGPCGMDRYVDGIDS